MRILIIGEFSGFSKYLSKGFRELGHTSYVFSWGDKFKNVQYEDDAYFVKSGRIKIGKYSIKGSGKLQGLISSVKLKNKISKMPKDWDCALIINLGFLKVDNSLFKPYPSILQIQSLLKNKKNIFLSAAGGDFIFGLYYAKREKKVQILVDKYNHVIKNEEAHSLPFYNHIRGVIPVSKEYADAYRYYKDKYRLHIFPTVQLPFDTKSVDYKNIIGEKIIIMHGINRATEKGSDFIIQALKKLENNYSENVEVVIVKHVSLSDYLKIMQKSNIVIDQCYAEGCGMNAIEAISMGKVVMGGNEPGNAEEYGELNSPVINIHANVEEIYNILVDLVNNPDKVKEISEESRKYAVRVHDCRTVAQKYIKIFSDNLASTES